MHTEHARGDVVQTKGGGVGKYVGTEPSGLEWFAYNPEDFNNMCVAFDERAKKHAKLAAINAPNGMSNTTKIAAISSVLAGTALLAWYCRPKDDAYGAKKAAGAPTVGSHVQAQYRDGNWYGATLLNADLNNPDAVRWDPGTMPASNNPRTGTSSARAVRDDGAPGSPAPAPGGTSGIPVGSRVSAQFKDGNWYGATLLNANLNDPDAVRWDTGTAAAIANPRTGTSPARAVKALQAAPQAAPQAVPQAAPQAAPQAEEKSVWDSFVEAISSGMPWFGDKTSAGPKLHALAASLTPAQKTAVHAARAAGMTPVQALASVGISPAQLAAIAR